MLKRHYSAPLSWRQRLALLFAPRLYISLENEQGRAIVLGHTVEAGQLKIRIRSGIPYGNEY